MLRQQFEANGYFFKRYLGGWYLSVDNAWFKDFGLLQTFSFSSKGHTLSYCSTLSLTVWKCVWMLGALGTRPDSSVAHVRPMLRCGMWSRTACCIYTFTLWGPSPRAARSPSALIMTTAAGEHTCIFPLHASWSKRNSSQVSCQPYCWQASPGRNVSSLLLYMMRKNVRLRPNSILYLYAYHSPFPLETELKGEGLKYIPH